MRTRDGTAVSHETPPSRSDVPFRRWQAAVANLTESERRAPHGIEADRLAEEVIAARLALTKARIADGWQPHDGALARARADELLISECSRRPGTRSAPR
jgi:hypothetical protein